MSRLIINLINSNHQCAFINGRLQNTVVKCIVSQRKLSTFIYSYNMTIYYNVTVMPIRFNNKHYLRKQNNISNMCIGHCIFQSNQVYVRQMRAWKDRRKYKTGLYFFLFMVNKILINHIHGFFCLDLKIILHEIDAYVN